MQTNLTAGDAQRTPRHPAIRWAAARWRIAAATLTLWAGITLTVVGIDQAHGALAVAGMTAAWFGFQSLEWAAARWQTDRRRS